MTERGKAELKKGLHNVGSEGPTHKDRKGKSRSLFSLRSPRAEARGYHIRFRRYHI
jgi:hypothetical protein